MKTRDENEDVGTSLFELYGIACGRCGENTNIAIVNMWTGSLLVS
jgi:hypothetical protein